MPGQTKDTERTSGVRRGLESAPDVDPAVQVVSNVFRKNRNRDVNPTPRRGTPSRGRGRRTSPVGAAFGNLASLGIAKFFAGNLRRKGNVTRSNQRFERKSGQEDRRLDILQEGQESLTAQREASTKLGRDRLGLSRDELKASESQFASRETRLQTQDTIRNELQMASIAERANVKFIGATTGFELPQRAETAKLNDAQKQTIRQLETRRDRLIKGAIGQFGSKDEVDAQIDAFDNRISAIAGSDVRFGLEEKQQQDSQGLEDNFQASTR